MFLITFRIKNFFFYSGLKKKKFEIDYRKQINMIVVQ